MGKRRVKTKLPSVSHVIARTMGRLFLFDDDDKDEMRHLLGIVAGFCGVTIITYALMSHHIHLLIRCDGECHADEEELIRRYGILYSNEKTQELRTRWKMLREEGKLKELQREQDRLRRRMWDISAFMKLLKQLWTHNYNRRHEWDGTIWGGRFKSLLVAPESILAVLCYIDLNCVRAGCSPTPGEYPWCGFAEAMGPYGIGRSGEIDCRAELLKLYNADMTVDHPKDILSKHYLRYYQPCFSLGSLPAKFWDKDGQYIGPDLSPQHFFRCRNGYFTKGTLIGNRKSLEKLFPEVRYAFGPRRKTCARKIRGCKALEKELYVARDLRKMVLCRPLLV